MKSEIELSVVIPVYNEEELITETIYSLKKHLPFNYEVIIVYDSDDDLTIPIVKQIKKNSSNIRLLKNTICPGPSGAIRSGVNKAKASKVLVTMADMSDDHSQIPLMVELMKQGVGVVCPSRYCRGGKQEVKKISTNTKILFPKLAGRLLVYLTGLPTNDPTNSYKLYSKKLLSSIELKSKVSFSVTLEIVAKAHCLGFNIKEIPTTWKERDSGKSNFKFFRSLIFYLPWFGISLLRGSFFSLSNKKLRKWFFRPSKQDSLI